jgi:hypothetical protein
MLRGESLPTFWRNVISPSIGKQCVKYYFPCDGVTSFSYVMTVIEQLQNMGPKLV